MLRMNLHLLKPLICVTYHIIKIALAFLLIHMTLGIIWESHIV